MSSFRDNSTSFSTRAIHSGYDPSSWRSRALVPPITMSSIFKQEDPVHRGEFFYGRLDNPSRSCVEKSLATLEEAEHALAFGSGTAAIAAVLQMLKAGDHVIAAEHLYSGTMFYFNGIATRQGIEVEFVNLHDLAALERSLKKNTKLVWLETPSNPTLEVFDLEQISAVISKHNAKNEGNIEVQDQTKTGWTYTLEKRPNKSTLLVVDNTFLTPYFLRPLELGADVVVHSCTKYLNGSSDVIMGAVCTNDHIVNEKLNFIRCSAGAIPSPFDCFLLQRSIRTLSVRMQRHMENGLAVAKFLEAHPHVRKVMHPGLPSHAQHKLALQQSYGHSGMVSFYLKEDNLQTSSTFLKSLKVVTLSGSLGGIESLVELPITMSHGPIPQEENERVGVTAGLVRLSVGLEDAQDLLQDLDQALNKAYD